MRVVCGGAGAVCLQVCQSQFTLSFCCNQSSYATEDGYCAVVRLQARVLGAASCWTMPILEGSGTRIPVPLIANPLDQSHRLSMGPHRVCARLTA